MHRQLALRILFAFFVSALLLFIILLYREHAVRSAASRTAIQVAAALHTRDTSTLQGLITTPPFLGGKTSAERDLLTLDLLKDEVSPEGMAILAREGTFGPLRKQFPAEADTWAKAFAVSPDDCVAFRLQRGSLTAELVLHRQPDSTYRILRCNDIRQLANP